MTMTWQETHRRWQALREIEESTRLDLSGELPWNDEIALIFGDRDCLVAHLRYRWNLTVEAQLDQDLGPDERVAVLRDLRARHAGVLRILARYPERGATSGGPLVHAS
ncbi:hypothetical protein ASD30_21120 [Nocardioides sp. Root140]|nr:hypothetical protein ASD30_21120 [Nocardioides sp. Root140]KRF14597.1 hypothetical protein ASH02_09785 [Nocardioides sp. Soil796]